ncbi:MAG: 30S ribosomal protein S16 [Candidatus Bipolaricaulaceae bacterium]
MAVKIRLKRVGKKKQPSYRVVVVEEEAKRDGETLAELGHLNPLADPEELQLDVEAALSWLERGARPTPAARRVLSRMGVMRAFHERRFGAAPAEAEQN